MTSFRVEFEKVVVSATIENNDVTISVVSGSDVYQKVFDEYNMDRFQYIKDCVEGKENHQFRIMELNGRLKLWFNTIEGDVCSNFIMYVIDKL